MPDHDLPVPFGRLIRVWFRNDVNAVKLNVDSNTVVYDDTWHHVAIVHVSDEFTIYVDGALDKSATYDTAAASFGTFSTDRIGIGAVLRQTACCLFTGSLDDFRVYNFALSALDVGLLVLGTPLLPCSASVGKYGFGCGGSLAITATGTAQYGQVLGLKLSGGTPNSRGLLLVGGPVTPLDLAFMSFPGCIAYPDLTTAILVGIGRLDSTGSSGTVNVTMPTSTSLGCLVGVIQGVSLSATNLELSGAIIAQLGN